MARGRFETGPFVRQIFQHTAETIYVRIKLVAKITLIKKRTY